MTEKNKIETGFGSDAKKNPQRIVFVTRKTSAKVTDDRGPLLMTYPHLLLREAIAAQILTVAVVLVALFWDAPLEQLANPLLTPNPAKAPWYFLGLQELLHYFPPFVAGIILPGLVVLALIVIPYFNVNIEGAPIWERNPARHFRIYVAVIVAVTVLLALFEAWTVLAPTLLIAAVLIWSYFAKSEAGRAARYFRSRPLSWWLMTWFVFVAVILTLVGTFFRGPGWSWVWPWRAYGA
jgi:menaquinol-cytochrome c reductase cytochrome b/c subunit